MLFSLSTDFLCFLPELFFGFFSCVSLFFYSYFSNTKPSFIQKTFVLRDLAFWLLLQVIFFTFLLSINTTASYITFFFGSLSFDLVSFYGRILLLFFVLSVFIIGQSYLCIKKINSFEFFVLFSLSCTGLCFMLQSNDFLAFYLALELQSLCFYALASFKRDSAFSVEAGLKYFVLGAIASGIYLFGCSLIYGTVGSTNFSIFSLFFSNSFEQTIPLSGFIGFFLVLVGFFFKLTAAPFHAWAPDTYEGAPTLVAFFFAVVPKIPLLLVFSRILFVCFYSWLFAWSHLLLMVSLLSIFIGAFGALSQKKIKRFFVFSSISHVGFILLALSSGSVFGLSSAFFYLAVYLFMVFGMWSFFFCFFKKQASGGFQLIKHLEDFRFLFQENPALAVFCTILLFSITGLPPLAGFYSKMFVFFSAITNTSLFFFIFIVIVLSVVGSFYYLRLIKIIAFENFTEKNFTSKHPFFTQVQKKQAFLLSFCFFFVTFFSYSPGLLFMLTHRIALGFVCLVKVCPLIIERWFIYSRGVA
jgi:NADH-quinone oxidoreductase subunit N